MNKLPKEKLQQLILVAIMSVIVSVVLWMFAIGKLNEKRAATKKEMEEIQAKIEDGNKKKQRAKASKETLKEREAELKKHESEMASGELFAWIDSKLNDFILQNGLEIDIPSKSRGDLAEVSVLPVFPYKAVKYAIRGTAFYHDFGKFVAAFENAFPYIRLQNIELTQGAQFDSSDPERLTFRFEIVALQKPAEAPAPSK